MRSGNSQLASFAATAAAASFGLRTHRTGRERGPYLDSQRLVSIDSGTSEHSGSSSALRSSLAFRQGFYLYLIMAFKSMGSVSEAIKRHLQKQRLLVLPTLLCWS